MPRRREAARRRAAAARGRRVVRAAVERARPCSPRSPSSLGAGVGRSAGCRRPRIVEHHGRTRQSRPRPPHRPRRPGFGRPAPAARHATGRGRGRPARPAADRLGERVRAQPLPARVQPGRRIRPGCSTAWRGRRGRLIEYWAHQAAFIPRERLFEFRRAEYRRKGTSEWGGWLGENRTLADWLRAELEANGPMPRARSSTTRTSVAGRGGAGPTSSARSSGCSAPARSCASIGAASSGYALPEQVLAPELIDAGPPSRRRPRARRARGIRLGIATAADLADYWRLLNAQVRPAIADLVDAGAAGHRARLDHGRRPTAAWSSDARRPPRRRRGPALAVRPGRVVPAARRAPVRLPLPHRDLHARGRPALRVLLAAAARRRSHRRPGRPQERPRGRAARAVGVAEPSAPRR